MSNIPKLILENPFRILGVYANSPKKNIVANKGRATAFLKVNRIVEYPLDLKGILPPLSRTLEAMNAAEAHLAIAKEQIKYAQFWFLNLTPLDDVAFNHLLAGDMDKAREFWSKQETPSSLQNRIVCFLIEEKPWLAIKAAEKLYSNFGDIYINKVDASSTLQMSASDLLHQFIDSLGEEIGMQKLLGYTLSEETIAYISGQTVGPLINKISAEVERTKKVDHKDPKARLDAANELISSTKEAYIQLKSILPSDDTQLQMIADKLGLEILQCGIDYFNNSDDDEAPHIAMKVQKQAQSMVIGTLAKQRCDENVKILQKIINELPPREVRAEDKAIKAELSKFVKLPDKISYAVSLLEYTKPHLKIIKDKLGASSSYYLKMSTQIVSNALHNVIEEVNEAQAPLAKLSVLLKGMDPYLRSSLISSFNIDEIRNKVKSTLREAWKATILMDGFDLESDFRTRYNQNRATLQSLCREMGVSTYVSTPPASHYRKATPPKTTLGHAPQSDNNSGSGCMVTLLALMSMAAMSIYCIVSII